MSELIKFIPDSELEFQAYAQALSEVQDWGLVSQNIPMAWNFSKGEGITVAVLDTGYFPHDDLKDNLLTPIDCTNSDVDDYVGHSVHCSGIIAACQNDCGIVGIAPKAKILPIKVLDKNGSGQYSWIEAGLRAAIDHNVDIINMSLGSADSPGGKMQDLINEAANKNIIVVAAAGNNAGAVNYPAAYDNVIGVAAIDEEKHLAQFSCRGANVDIAAPGTNVYSTYLNNGYAVLNGTSQAAPFISGMIALLLSYYNSVNDTSYKQTAAMLKLLDSLGGEDGANLITDGQFKYGVPSFANHKPWIKNGS